MTNSSGIPSASESEDRLSALNTRHNAHSFKRLTGRGFMRNVSRNVSSGRNSTPSWPNQRFYGNLQRPSGRILCLPASATLSALLLAARCSLSIVTFDIGHGSPSGLCAAVVDPLPDQSGDPILRCAERTKLLLIIAVPAVHRPTPRFRSSIEAHLSALDMSIRL